MPQRVSDLRIPLSDDARRALERSPLAGAAADGALDGVELESHDLSLDALGGVGHEQGQPLAGDAGRTLAARALALDPRSRLGQVTTTTAERTELAARQREIARALATAGRAGEAFSALSTALLIEGVNPAYDMHPRLTPEQATEIGSLADLVASARLPAQLARRLATAREQLRLGGMTPSETGMLMLALAGRRGDAETAARGLVLVPELLETLNSGYGANSDRYGTALVHEIARRAAKEASPEGVLRTAHETSGAWSRGLRAANVTTMPPAGTGLHGMVEVLLHGGPFVAAGLVDPETLHGLAGAVSFQQKQDREANRTRSRPLEADIAQRLADPTLDRAEQRGLAEALTSVLQSRNVDREAGLAFVQEARAAGARGPALAAATRSWLSSVQAGVAPARATAFAQAAFVDRTAAYPPVLDVVGRIAARAAGTPDATPEQMGEAARTLTALFARAGDDVGAFFALDLLDKLELPPAALHPERMGVAIATRLNEAPKPAETTEVWPDTAALINALHDAEGATMRSDRIRERFMQTLTPESALRLVTHGGATLYTSSFLGAWRHLRAQLGEKKLGAYLDERFPARPLSASDAGGEEGDEDAALRSSEHQAIRAGLLRTIGRFGLDDAYGEAEAQLRPFVIREILGSDGSEASDAVGGAARYTRFLTRAWESLPAGERERIEAKLVAGVRGESSEPEIRGAHAFVLKALYDAESTLGPDATSIAGTLPPPDDRQPPVDTWLADGKLTTRMFFYDDEPWFEDTVRFYRRRGFSPTDRRPIDAQTREVVLERETAAGTQRIVFSRESASESAGPGEAREAVLKASDVDIIVHRGHSFHFGKTFPNDIDAHGPHAKLLIGGSCGSYGEMSSGRFLATYGQHRFIADTNTGEGSVNNQMLLQILDAVAGGAKTWEDMRLADVAEQRGLVLPNDPAFTVSSYIHELTRRDALATPEARP